MLVGIPRALARSCSISKSSDSNRIDNRPLVTTGSTRSGEGDLTAFVGTNDASMRRFNSADAVMPWSRAMFAKRAFVSRVTQVIRCVPSLIVERLCIKELPLGYPA